ncbi:pyridoxal 5'-phosphate synthase glutaminase subunit PdxT [Candidatus Altiarchaeota archaeon]
MKIGVLSVQGNVDEHVAAMERALKKTETKGEVLEIKRKEDFEAISALILPGGESTTMGKLLVRYGVDEEIKKLALAGKPIMATCAGMILLAKEGNSQVQKTKQPLLNLLDVKVNRNAFGRQRESFEVPLKIEDVGEDYPAVFIRAPAVDKVWGNAKILAKHKEKIVAIQQDNILGLSFHPELTKDTRVHEYFLGLI